MIKELYPIFFVFILLVVPLTSCAQSERQITESESVVKTGAEMLIVHHLDELSGKRVGLAMNPTARIGSTHMLDTLIQSGLNITALFAAEHGFRGDQADGEIIKDGVDQSTGLPVFSLYTGSKKPTKEMLELVDVIIFDMQDVGGRFYTYYQTLFNIIEEAAIADVEVWVLDRPNPAGGNYVQGWILDEDHSSFVGRHPIPMAHGLTMGELATMAIGEAWIDSSSLAQLKVIKMQGWERSMKWSDTQLDWVAPSPNLPSFEHAFIYLGTVLFEGVSVSEGRGTPNPFLTVGSPNVKIDLNQLNEIGSKYSVKLDTLHIVPREIKGKATNPKYQDEKITSIKISNLDFKKTDPIQLGLDLLLYFESNDKYFTMRAYLNNLAGVDLINMIESSYVDFVDEEEIEAFKVLRKPYLLYD